MELDKYQSLVMATWVDGDPEKHHLDINFIHALLGLVGESGELLGTWHIIKSFCKNGEKPFPNPVHEWLASMMDEIGDIYYYAVALTTLYGFSAEKMIEAKNNDSSTSDEAVERLVAEVNKIAERYNKTVFKPNYVEKGTDSLEYSLGSVFRYLNCFLRDFGFDLKQIAILNREKLRDNRHGWPERTV